METLTGWKNYIVEGYHYVVSEAWQLGSDARSEAATIYTDVVSNTSDIYVDLTTADYYKTTEAEKKNCTQVEEIKAKNEKITFLDGERPDEKEQEKIGIFAVETYSSKTTPAIVNVSKFDEIKIANDDKVSIVESNF